MKKEREREEREKERRERKREEKKENKKGKRKTTGREVLRHNSTYRERELRCGTDQAKKFDFHL